VRAGWFGFQITHMKSHRMRVADVVDENDNQRVCVPLVDPACVVSVVHMGVDPKQFHCSRDEILESRAKFQNTRVKEFPSLDDFVHERLEDSHDDLLDQISADELWQNHREENLVAEPDGDFPEQVGELAWVLERGHGCFDVLDVDGREKHSFSDNNSDKITV